MTKECEAGRELWGYCHLAIDHNNPSFVVNPNTTLFFFFLFVFLSLFFCFFLSFCHFVFDCYLALDHNNPPFVVDTNPARVLQDIRPKLPHKLSVLVVDLDLVRRGPEHDFSQCEV